MQHTFVDHSTTRTAVLFQDTTTDLEDVAIDELGLYRWLRTGFASLRDEYLHPILENNAHKLL